MMLKLSLRNIFSRPYAILAIAVLLYAISFLFSSKYSQRTSINREWKKLEAYVQEQQQDFLDLLEDSTLIRKLATKKETLDEFDYIADQNFGVYLYRKQPFYYPELVFWSDQMVLPPDTTHGLGEGSYFQKLANGYYLTVKRKLPLVGEDSIHAYGLIPIQYRYFLETDYLPDRFIFSAGASRRIAISQQTTSYPVNDLSGETKFYLVPKSFVQTGSAMNQVSVWLRIFSVILLLMFIHLFAENLNNIRGVWVATHARRAFLGACLLAA